MTDGGELSGDTTVREALSEAVLLKRYKILIASSILTITLSKNISPAKHPRAFKC